MCGIAGIANSRLPAEDLAAALHRMRECLVHRGPDQARSVVSPEFGAGLASRRLSIVDLLTRCGYRDIQTKGINPTGSLKFKLFHALSLGKAADMQYLQFACSASHGDPDSTEKGVA